MILLPKGFVEKPIDCKYHFHTFVITTVRFLQHNFDKPDTLTNEESLLGISFSLDNSAGHNIVRSNIQLHAVQVQSYTKASQSAIQSDKTIQAVCSSCRGVESKVRVWRLGW